MSIAIIHNKFSFPAYTIYGEHLRFPIFILREKYHALDFMQRAGMRPQQKQLLLPEQYQSQRYKRKICRKNQLRKLLQMRQ